MRVNHPVTGREHPIPEGLTLMSATDPESRIVYANAAFVDTSGFSTEELQGAPHNIVRHPDMPPQAFSDMWATLRHGLPWSALVKNRRKNGDHYWVRANAAPMFRDGKPIGYMSVRTRPSVDEVRDAERLYTKLMTSDRPGIRLHRGVVLRTGLGRALSALKWLPARARVAAGLFVAAIGPALGAMVAQASPGQCAAVTAGAIAAAVVGGLVIDRLLISPLLEVCRHANAIACGELEHSRVLDRVDEVGMLMRAVDQTGLKLRTFVEDVADRLESVRSGTHEIANANLEMSGRTERSAASLEQTAAAMDQLNATVQTNDETTRQANDIAGEANQAATAGSAKMGAITGQMSKIAQASQQISEITALIDGIAFQTNILSLNAAIEAARAGEAGRGFAVVAAEVRGLAQRSASAAREIRTLIDDAAQKVEGGNEQVTQANAAMDQIVAKVSHVRRLIETVGNATAEQSNGIAQVNLAVADLDRATQQNSAMVEETAAASRRLDAQAQWLSQSVEVFRQG